MQRGELLSRVTNDIDNISQTPAADAEAAAHSLLTVIGVLVMMFVISPLLALVALVDDPAHGRHHRASIAKRSQKLFVAQWTHTGALNAAIEETFTGHALVKVFGRQQRGRGRLRRRRTRSCTGRASAPSSSSGIIMPAMMFVGNLVYVGIAVVGGLQVANGSLRLGDVQAFIQYSRQFTQPLTQLGSMANLLQSGVASAERVFELLDADEQIAGSRRRPESPDRRRTGASSSRTCRSATTRTSR